MSNSILKSKSFLFAVRIIRLAEYLKKQYRIFELANQVFRAGTAIGALIREAEFAESPRDFIHKMHIALKEANEVEYWLELAFTSSFINLRIFRSLSGDNKEILKMLIATIKTSKARLQ